MRPLLRSLLVAVAILTAGCSTERPREDPAVTTTSLDLDKVQIDDLTPSEGAAVTPKRTAGAVAVPVEAVRDIGDGSVVVTAFIAPCATVSEVTIAADRTAKMLVADPDCSEKRTLVAVTVKAQS